MSDKHIKHIMGMHSLILYRLKEALFQAELANHMLSHEIQSKDYSELTMAIEDMKAIYEKMKLAYDDFETENKQTPEN